MTVAEAKAKQVCRLCGLGIGRAGLPADWPEQFRKLLWPINVTLNFGAEFAHTACLDQARTE